MPGQKQEMWALSSLRSLLKLDDEGKLTGLTEQLDKLKTDKAFLFADGDEPAGRIDTGLDHGSATETITDAQARAVMGLPAAK